MKKKHKITLLVVGILLALSLMLSSSYALWVFNVSQESTNVVVSDCFEMTFTEGTQAIHLTDSFPMKDGKGVYTDPYVFTLTNICEHAADISINLETLNDSQIDGENLRVDVNGHIRTYGDNNTVEPTLSNASSAASFYNDTIAAGDSKSYNLRLWIKEDADSNDVINKTLSSKITVRSTLRKNYSEANLISGPNFNKAIKSLSGTQYPVVGTYNTTITSIERSTIEPQESDNATLISTSTSVKPIYAWFNDGTIYIYTEANKIIMDADSSSMFREIQSIDALDLSYFDTSEVMNMGNMFWGCNSLEHLDVSNFNTSNVTNMSWMFGYLNAISNLDVSNFDTSKVTDMAGMFYSNTALVSLNVSHFNTLKVTDMNHMFHDNSILVSLDLNSFDTSNVTNMSHMLNGMKKIEILDLSGFSTSNVTIMSSMFNNCNSLTNLDVSNFDTSSVTKMDYMFGSCYGLTSLDLGNFDTSNVTDMSHMFYSSQEIKKLDLSSFDTSKVTDMTMMFSGLKKITSLNLSNFNTSNVTSMYAMFYYNNNLTDLNISSFDTSKVENMQSMFHSCYNLTSLDLSSFDTSNVTNMWAMFYAMWNIRELDLSSFDTLKVENMRSMFQSDGGITTIYVSNKWSTSSVTNSYSMFNGAVSLVGQAGTTYSSDHMEADYAHVDGGTSNPGYFTLKTS